MRGRPLQNKDCGIALHVPECFALFRAGNLDGLLTQGGAPRLRRCASPGLSCECAFGAERLSAAAPCRSRNGIVPSISIVLAKCDRGATEMPDSEFDPYSSWLGIPEGERPPDHYALLGLERFESDRNKIERAVQSRFNVLLDYQFGSKQETAIRLVDEITRAGESLKNDHERQRYDQQLRERQRKSEQPTTTSEGRNC